MTVLVFAPHADDESLGMGGTIALHSLLGDDVIVICFTWHGPTRWAELQRACAVLGCDVRTPDDSFQDGHLDDDRQRLVTAMDSCLAMFRPTTVYLPYPSLHQDHRAVFEAGTAACRVSLDPDHWWVPTVYVYGSGMAEQPLYPTGLTFNRFVDISGEPMERKRQAIRNHASQNLRLPYPSDEQFLDAEAVQVGGMAMMDAAERFAVWRQSWRG